MSKYYKYQLTFPYQSNKIYKSSDINKAIKKCYSDYKHLVVDNNKIFVITNLDTNEKYKIIVKNDMN